MSTNYPWMTASFQSPRLPAAEGDAAVGDRQDRVTGFSTSQFATKSVLLAGAGGIGSSIALPLARKGVGTLVISDPDIVDLSNLSRQEFLQVDLHQSKALCLAKNAGQQGFLGTLCVGHQVAFTGATADALTRNIDVAVVGVDNNLTRLVACRFFRQRRLPVVFTAISEQADYGWVFVQEPTGPCLACVFPALVRADSQLQPCPAVPAIVDILKVVAGISLYAIDSLVLARDRHWNFRSVHLAGGSPDLVSTALPRPACPLCGGA